MAEIFSKTISSNLPELERLLLEVSEFLEMENLQKQSHAVELTLEELITNTIKYGYDDKAAHQIEIRLAIQPTAIQITITDDGHEFNPFSAAEVDVSKPVEEREIGGLGIHLVRKLAASTNYQRLGGKNILKLGIAAP